MFWLGPPAPNVLGTDSQPYAMCAIVRTGERGLHSCFTVRVVAELSDPDGKHGDTHVVQLLGLTVGAEPFIRFPVLRRHDYTQRRQAEQHLQCVTIVVRDIPPGELALPHAIGSVGSSGNILGDTGDMHRDIGT